MSRNRRSAMPSGRKSGVATVFPLLMLAAIAVPVYFVLAGSTGQKGTDPVPEETYDRQHFQSYRYLFKKQAYLWTRTASGRFNRTNRPIQPGKYHTGQRIIRVHEPNMLYVPAEQGWIIEEYTSAVSLLKTGDNSIATGERIDKWYSVPAHYRPSDLVPIPAEFSKFRTVLLRKAARDAFVKMCRAAQQQGIRLFGFSGFRSWDDQERLYLRRITIGKKLKQRAVARPGHSEHHLGTAVDVVGKDSSLAARTAFRKTAEAAWIKRHCWKFGFVLSYSDMNLQPTGYIHESWHLRFLGSQGTVNWIKRSLSPQDTQRLLQQIRRKETQPSN